MFASLLTRSFAATVKKQAPTLKLRKAALSLTPAAVNRLKELYEGEEMKVLKIGVRTKGCSGLSYALDYVTQKARFDEEVVQDGVKILVDSKALLSIIGSEMDFVEDKLSSQFVFYNPNIKEACGCGQSFMV
ncbi:Iron-sulfur assembly protein 1 [Entomophthora muscae]|uniref:Iron-sulfur assembly protein 1 n=1 Tax=Entomophthora muscae TaxID=34485 RepID=A0ACC2RQF6_9FUNG|nr:Iron-sulfur assembly protein 1 [Entomophthora muscae]